MHEIRLCWMFSFVGKLADVDGQDLTSRHISISGIEREGLALLNEFLKPHCVLVANEVLAASRINDPLVRD